MRGMDASLEAKAGRKRPRVPRALAWILAGLVVFVLLVLGGRSLLVGMYRGRVEDELERIRAAGDPVLPEDLVVPDPGEGEDALAWLAALEEARASRITWIEDHLRDVEQFELLMEEVRESEVPAEHIALLDEIRLLHDELGGNQEAIDRFWTGFRTKHNDSDASFTRQECTVLRAIEVGARIHPEDLDTLRTGVRLDMARLLEGILEDLDFAATEQPTDIHPALPTGLLVLTDLGGLAVVAAHQGRADEALDRLELALRAAELCEDVPWLYVGHDLWLLLASSAVQAVVPTAAGLPPGTDLGAIEARLAELDPRANLVRAMRGERALGNRVFASFRAHAGGSGPFSEGQLSRLLAGMFFARDHAIYLELMRDAIQLAESPPHEVLRARDCWRARIEPSPRWAPLSSMLVPMSDVDDEFARSLEASILFARGALIVRREGLEAGLAWIDARTDPFDGSPLRHRVDEDGTVVLWSVGADGVDDSGVGWDEDWGCMRDVVLRFRPH